MIVFLEVPISSHILTWLVKRKDGAGALSQIWRGDCFSGCCGILSHVVDNVKRFFLTIAFILAYAKTAIAGAIAGPWQKSHPGFYHGQQYAHAK